MLYGIKIKKAVIKVKKYRKVKIDSMKVQDIICNMCGNAVKKESENVFSDYLAVEKVWSYLSSFDCQCHKFDLCEDCYKKLISSFAIPPEIDCE